MTRRARLILTAALAGAGGAVVGFVGAGLTWVAWTFSGMLLRPDWKAGPHLRAQVKGEEVTLPHRQDADTPGLLGITWDGGWAVLGGMTARDEAGGTRPLLRASTPLADGARVQPIPNVYDGTPEQVGLDFSEVQLPSPHGDVPAWVVPAEGEGLDWMVFVHGHGGRRAQSIRLLPAARALSLTSLVVSYRNTREGPRTKDGYARLGATEWEDIEAALRFARERGARRVILFGYSMGGNIVLSALRHSQIAREVVVGAVLDAPALDWRDLLRDQATRMRLPAFGAGLVELAATLRLRQRFETVNHLRGTEGLNVPLLIFHGDQDETVPLHQSERLACARPDLVRLLTVPGAAHIRAWNLDPNGYEAELQEWVRKLLNDTEPPQGGILNA